MCMQCLHYLNYHQMFLKRSVNSTCVWLGFPTAKQWSWIMLCTFSAKLCLLLKLKVHQVWSLAKSHRGWHVDDMRMTCRQHVDDVWMTCGQHMSSTCCLHVVHNPSGWQVVRTALNKAYWLPCYRLDDNLLVKISDFGLTKDLGDSTVYQSRGENEVLPVRWMSVEALTGHVFSKQSDVVRKIYFFQNKITFQ